MREFINLVEAREKSGVILDNLLSFSQSELLQMYVDGFNDQDAMEYWLQADADALPETPEIAREWMKANYAEESSRSLAEMILGDMSEQDIRDYGMNSNEYEMDETISHSDALELADVAQRRGAPVPKIAQDVLDQHENVDEDMDEFGYDADAEMDRGSMVQGQIGDVLSKTDALMDKIGNEEPTAEQQAVLNGYADQITRLEKSLEN